MTAFGARNNARAESAQPSAATVTSLQTKQLETKANQPAKRKLRNGKERLSREAEDLTLIREIESDINKVSPEFFQLTKSIRNFASRYLSSETPHKAVLGVISPRPGEGRTTVSLGLAGALAEIYSRVVMVEMETDEVAPTLCMEMNLGISKGLRDYLSEDVALEDVLLPTDKENLWFLPAGPVSHQASRLDATSRTRELLNRLSEDFDVVVVDLPPVLTSEEAPALLAAMDGVVLVVNAGSTTTDDVNRALELCASVPVRGVLLNKLHLRAPRWLASLIRS